MLPKSRSTGDALRHSAVRIASSVAGPMIGELMRLVAIALCSVISAGTAAAQPGACNVTIVRAPDGVREVVESWVRAEPRCMGTLEVRILATDGGYYLFARDGTGRIRERLVPDPQSAGVLIASWAADDAPPPPPVVQSLPPSFTPARVSEDPFVDAAPRPARSWSWGGWLTVAGVASSTTGGLRAESDIVTRGPITAGLALSVTSFELPWGNNGSNVSGHDVRLVVYGTDTFHQGPLSMRIGLGVGAMYTSGSLLDGEMVESYNAGGSQPVGELSMELGYDLGNRWSVTAGAVGTVFEQAWITGWGGTAGLPAEVKRYGDILGMFGIRCRL
jgi:hypothetical protein